jgi:hypothetical protein
MNARQLQERLRAANPLALGALADLDLRLGEEEMVESILAVPREAAAAPRRRRVRLLPEPRLARLALVVLAAAALGAAIALLSRSAAAEPALAEVLDDAAASAAAQQPTVPGPHQFLYTRSEDAYLLSSGRWSVLVPSRRQSWLSFDSSRTGRVREVNGRPRFVSADQRAGWLAAGSPPLPQAGAVDDATISGGSMIDPAGLPTDPPRLRALIEARQIAGVEGPPGAAETFVLVGDMLRESYLPSALRAALYGVLAELPGVELLGEVSDPAGRAGTAVAYADRRRGVRRELVFDPETSALLAERQTVIRQGAFGFRAPLGTTVGYAVYLESKLVDSVGRGAPAGAGGADTSVGCYDRAARSGNVTVVHSPDPVAKCEELWREGIVDSRAGPTSPPPLVPATGSAG